MRKTLFTGFILLVGFVITAQAQRSLLNRYVLNKEFHKLKEALPHQALTDNDRKVYTAVLENAFGQPAASNQLLNGFKRSIKIAGDTLSYFYYRTLYDNYVQLFDYSNAQSSGTTLLKYFEDFFNEEDFKAEMDALVLWKAFVNTPAQTISQPDSVSIALKKDIAGLWNIPVSSNDSTYNFIFDSGAGLSTISETYAAKLGLKMMEGYTIPVPSGITGIPTQSKLGVAAELRVKDIVVHNCIFLVFPDSALSFGNGAYVINGIIGFPVIREMGGLHFTGNDLLVTKHVTAQDMRNLIMDQLKPVVYLKYGNDVLPFTFDFGASHTIFSDVFYKRYKTKLDKEGVAGKDKFTGTSGAKTFDVVKLPTLKMQCADKTITLKDAPVSKEPLSTTGEIYYGNVGQDVIRQFKTMHISFKDCYLYFE
jgi:hypothetical protein